MDEIRVNTRSMDTDIQSLRNEISNLRNQKNKMVEEIQILSTMWKGPANDVFRAQFDADKQALENLCQTLEKMVQALEQARTKYDQCNNRVSELVQSVRV